MLLLGRDAEVAAFVGERIGSVFTHAFVGIGVVNSGAMTGGVIFHNWNGSNIDAAAALDSPLRRGDIKGLRHYVFDQLKARRVTMRPAMSNRKAVALLAKRATIETILPAYNPDGDSMQFVIYPHDRRWLRWKVEV